MKKDAIVIILGRVLQFILNLLLIKSITRFLSKEQVAIYFLALSVLNYFGLALISPIGQFFNRSINKWYEDRVLVNRIFIHSVFTIALCVVTGPLFYFLNKYFNIFNIKESGVLVSIIIFGVFTNTLLTTIVPIFNFLGNRLLYVFYSSLMLLFSFAGSLSAIFIFEPTVINWLLGHFLSQLFLSFFSLIHLSIAKGLRFSFKESHSNFRWERARGVLSFSAPLFLSTFFMWIGTDSFRFIVERTHGLKYLGVLSVGFVIAQKLSFAAESLIQQILFPYFYKEMDNTSKEARQKSWLALFYLSLPCYLIVMSLTILMREPLVLIFSDIEYASASSFVALAAVFHFFRKMSAIFAIATHSEKQTRLLILPYFIGIIFGTLPLFSLDKGSFLLPAIILILGSFSTFLVMYLQTKKVLRIYFDKEVINRIKLNFLG